MLETEDGEDRDITTPTSRLVSMIPSDFQFNPFIDARPGLQSSMRSSFAIRTAKGEMKPKSNQTSFLKLLFILCLYPLVCGAEEPARDELIRKTYQRDEILEMVVTMRTGGLFLKTGAERYYWRPYEQELPARLDVIFHFLAHIDRARGVEIVRRPPNEEEYGNGPREREGESYHSIEEINIIFDGERNQ